MLISIIIITCTKPKFLSMPKRHWVFHKYQSFLLPIQPYLIMPLKLSIVQMMQQDTKDLSGDNQFWVVFGFVSCILTLVCTFSIVVFYRNTIPSRDPLSVIQRSVGNFFFTVGKGWKLANLTFFFLLERNFCL